MSRDDYDLLTIMLGYATAKRGHLTPPAGLPRILEFMNRLNEGNPHYTPYQVEAKKVHKIHEDQFAERCGTCGYDFIEALKSKPERDVAREHAARHGVTLK